MAHHTKDKGDIATTAAIFDLTKKGYVIFTPLSEHLRFDLIAYKDEVLYRIQVKYCKDGFLRDKTNWNDKNGTHVRYYELTDFDYYAIYLPSIDKVVYPNISFKGCTIRQSIPGSPTPFYWWEDFTELTDIATKKTLFDFNRVFVPSNKGVERPDLQKVPHPSKNELKKLLWEKPTSTIAEELGVSSTAVAKWAKAYGISKPPRGYWAKVLLSKK